MAYQTWSEKIADVRARDRERRRAASREKPIIRRPSGPVHDAFDIFSQLVGVTNEWTEGSLAWEKRKKR